MADNWDDSDDDDWDVDDDALDAKLGITKTEEPANNFDDEEDLALTEKAEQERLAKISLKKKGSALAARKQAEKDRADDLEIARKALAGSRAVIDKPVGVGRAHNLSKTS